MNVEFDAETKTKLRYVRQGIIQRCSNPNHKDYHRYGGRGIHYDPEIFHSQERFEELAKLKGYKPGLSIDRINNDKGYFPDNITWSDKTQSNRNRSIVRMTPLKVWMMRDIFKKNFATKEELAQYFLCKPSNVNHILAFRSWADIQELPQENRCE